MKMQAAKLFILAACVLGMFACAKKAANDDGAISGKITVISREEGSGTRSAFVELFGVVDSDKKDVTTDDAQITNNTAVMIGSVQQDRRAIGYISMGSMNDAVKTLKIDGVSPSVENVMNKSYSISRPFVIAITEQMSDVAQDFIDFILSAEGQAVVTKSGYIGKEDAATYVSKNVGGKIVIAGSSSVSPLMEKLKEAYIKLNENVTIEIQTSDSSTGMKAAIEGICDIGMSSRELKSSELEKLTPLVIATDGIIVIVSKENSIDNLAKEQVKNVFLGEITDWKDLR
ncbi:MAG: substrate-binding domain-containing protein [Chitinivibrionia bacterium]|nr:substrate-binding domain-containing protein [Chitinivibrionia bacterium]